MSYVPQQGSVAWKVIEFLTTNPEEELSKDDIAAKFDATANNVHTLLRQSVEAGLLNRTEVEDELVYRLGNGTPLIKPNKAGNPSLGKGGATWPSNPAGKRRKLRELPDLDGIQIEQGVDKPTPQLLSVKWNALFDRMKPGKDSFRLPIEHKYSVGKAASNYKRDGHGELTIRQISETEIRVWRDK